MSNRALLDRGLLGRVDSRQRLVPAHIMLQLADGPDNLFAFFDLLFVLIGLRVCF